MPPKPDHPPISITRRQALSWAAAAPLLMMRPALAAGDAAAAPAGTARDVEYAHLERAHRRRLGVYAVDTATGREVTYRAHERFAFCSTFKAVLAGAILSQDAAQPGLLDQRILYTAHELASYSPVTEKHVHGGMTIAQLCAAAIQYSDNTAANLLLHRLGGPRALTAYARGLGNPTFRLDRFETALNTSIPGDERDTSTPADMARTLETLVLGDALPPGARARLKTWLLGNKTGDRRIRAAVPPGWQVADKTGTGDYASANDFGVIWPADRPPVVLAIYTASRDPHAKADESLIAEAARIALAALA
ncbi:class A beta-lactamase [Bordetella genomosp. 11]|uniref:Beta-lactamase n=1 Tax=Bordetella genomosp. 11 TaxID=1416808 RepID=A0A261UE73_9BORD|nr:class A beta-lactamase [Bordetella genomosp. 11]OZI60238.1 class A beta-lactamase [Bordetella genomosp. 11]